MEAVKLNKHFQKKRFCMQCGRVLEMREDQQCETCKLKQALSPETDVIQLTPEEVKQLAGEVNAF